MGHPANLTPLRSQIEYGATGRNHGYVQFFYILPLQAVAFVAAASPSRRAHLFFYVVIPNPFAPFADGVRDLLFTLRLPLPSRLLVLVLWLVLLLSPYRQRLSGSFP
jgi:hypothetical protein